MNMASNQTLALPSTSCEPPRTGKGETDKNDLIAIRCLNVIEKIASKLKSDTNDFVDVLQKILAVFTDASEHRDLKCDLIHKVMSNVTEAEREELMFVKDDFRKIFCTREVKKLLVDNSAIVPSKMLGEGQHLIAKLGLLRRPDGTSTVAVIKRVKDILHKNIIANEASVMAQLNHKNILKILAVNKSEPEIVLELMDLGNVNFAVQMVNFTNLNLLRILIDIASGMEYLHGKKYLHRNLNCRNVYLNSKKKCKIGEFGFSVYVGNSDGVYMEKVHDVDPDACPEALLSKEFTMASDKWSMGILCWELFYVTENANKIPTSVSTKKIHLEKFRAQRIPLPKPNRCPDALYEYINSKLLNMNPKMRPTFPAIGARIKEIVSNLK